MAWAMVLRSTYSSSLPAGTPRARRVTLRPARAQRRCQGVRRDLAFGGEAGGQDHFLHHAVAGALEQPRRADVAHAHAVERAEAAHEHEVQALVAAAALQRRLVGRRLHHAQLARVAPRVQAGAADLGLGEGVAARAVPHVLQRMRQRRRPAAARRRGRAAAGGRPCAAPTSRPRRAGAAGRRSGRRGQVRPSAPRNPFRTAASCPAASGSPAVSLPIFSALTSSARRTASLKAAATRSSSMSLSSASRLGSMAMRLHVVLAGHGHLHQPGAGLALDLHQRQFVLRALHVVLHRLGLLHQAGQLALHHGEVPSLKRV